MNRRFKVGDRVRHLMGWSIGEIVQAHQPGPCDLVVRWGASPVHPAMTCACSSDSVDRVPGVRVGTWPFDNGRVGP